MNFLQLLDQRLNDKHLLEHPFYQKWNGGLLTTEMLQIYAKEYYHHVAAFPRYISAIHSLCPDIKSRQTLLGNLIDEEQGEENHPELWQKFIEGLGMLRSDLKFEAELMTTKELVEGYFDLTRLNYPTGLGALYAYERQTPSVAESKIAGLTKYYNVNDEHSLKFFTVHMEVDQWHTEELVKLIQQLNPEDQLAVAKGAETGATLLWQFLDGFDISSIVNL